MQRSRRVVEAALAADRPVYGVNTGLGRLSDQRIPADHLRELQLNLVRSHAAGVGPPLPPDAVRALLLLRANSLAKGLSGVRPVIVERLCDLLNARVHPVVPSRGSVGASGDLAPLAAAALVLIGEGEATIGEAAAPLPGAEALRRAGVEPLRLEAKEGLSLLNGTQAMLAVGVLGWLDARRLADNADVVATLSLEALRGTPVAFDPRLQAARPHPGQAAAAARVWELMRDSEIRASHRDCGRVQDAYSLRCVPQVHGAVRDALARAEATFAIEANAAVDNPLVFVREPAASTSALGGHAGAGAAESDPRGDILSGGNFHGQPLAFILDALTLALTALAGISERRLERLVNPALNEGLPAFLASQPGLQSGLMMAQVTAAALVSENRSRAHPASADSITTSGNKEDFVSMGMGAALKFREALDTTRLVLAIEALAAARALDLLAPLRPGPRLRPALEAVRGCVPPFTGDRPLSADFAAVAELLRSRDLFAPSKLG